MLTCARCGRDNPAGASFCNSCGSELGTAAASREVRKTVTVLFCDLPGSTALGAQTDPEVLRALLARYFEQMKATVESHGGAVEKFVGDAVMAGVRGQREAALVPLAGHQALAVSSPFGAKLRNGGKRSI